MDSFIYLLIILMPESRQYFRELHECWGVKFFIWNYLTKRGVDGALESWKEIKAESFINLRQSRLKVVCKRYDIARPAYVHSSHFACPLIGGAGAFNTRRYKANKYQPSVHKTRLTINLAL